MQVNLTITEKELKFIAYALIAIAIMLYVIMRQLIGIAKRMRQHFPTEKEADYDMSQSDPHGHWELHKNDKR